MTMQSRPTRNDSATPAARPDLLARRRAVTVVVASYAAATLTAALFFRYMEAGQDDARKVQVSLIAATLPLLCLRSLSSIYPQAIDA